MAICAAHLAQVGHAETAADIGDSSELAGNIRDSVTGDWALVWLQGLPGQLGPTSARHIRLSTPTLALFYATVLSIGGRHRNKRCASGEPPRQPCSHAGGNKAPTRRMGTSCSLP